jgi:hypothetical protein
MGSPAQDWLWGRLAGLDLADVVRATGASYERGASTFELLCFGQPIRISPGERVVCARSAGGEALLASVGPGFPMLVLGYLAQARGGPPARRLIHPAQLPGGEIFERGTHVLPLDRVARRFGDRAGEFLRRARELQGTALEYGDMSAELWPFPRLPITVIVWSGDDEFPPRASLLLHAHCGNCLPTDIIWSAASLTVDLLLG